MTATARCARTLLVIAAALVAARCARYEEIWSGVRVERDGTIRLVADEPFCACVDLVNRSGAPVELRSRKPATFPRGSASRGRPSRSRTERISSISRPGR